MILLFTPVIVYYSFDVPDSPGVEIYGEVTDRSIDAATYYELPGMIVRVKLESGKIIDLGIPDQRVLNVGDLIVISKTNSILTGAEKYEFLRLVTE